MKSWHRILSVLFLMLAAAWTAAAFQGRGQRPRPEGAAPGQEAAGEEGGPRDPLSAPTFNGLRLRSIGRSEERRVGKECRL